MELTNQQLFDKVVGSLLEQNEKSVSGRGDYSSCLYRVFLPDRTLKCAAGHCIPDEIYDPEMEGQEINILCENRPGLREKMGVSVFQVAIGFNGTYGLLVQLQTAHDINSVDRWKEVFRNIAKMFHLDESVIDKFEETV